MWIPSDYRTCSFVYCAGNFCKPQSRATILEVKGDKGHSIHLLRNVGVEIQSPDQWCLQYPIPLSLRFTSAHSD